MNCPKCGRNLGEGMLPARCPACGTNLANPTDAIRGQRASASRQNVEGLTGIGKGNTSKRTRHYVQVFIAILLVASFGTLLWFVSSGFGTMTAPIVPDVVGWRSERAVEKLEESGYEVRIETTTETDVPEGLVITQTPLGKSELANGSTVIVTVAATKVMPSLVGATQSDAEAKLNEAGIPFTIQDQFSDETADTVIETNPVAGAPLAQDETAQVVIARTPSVPDLVGKTQAEASELILAQGLELEVNLVPPAQDQTPGTIVSQNPSAGSNVGAGSKVSVDVVTSTDQQLRDAATEVIKAVYNTDPKDDAIGSALLPLLSDQNPYKNASPHDVWWNLVKRGGLYGNQPSEIQELKRSLVSSSFSVDEENKTVHADVTVHWDWTGLPQSNAEGSTDTRTVTMTFDDDGKLVTFYDEQTDVPYFDVQEGDQQNEESNSQTQESNQQTSDQQSQENDQQPEEDES